MKVAHTKNTHIDTYYGAMAFLAAFRFAARFAALITLLSFSGRTGGSVRSSWYLGIKPVSTSPSTNFGWASRSRWYLRSSVVSVHVLSESMYAGTRVRGYGSRTRPHCPTWPSTASPATKHVQNGCGDT